MAPLRAVTLLAALACLAVASPASADPEWHIGTSEQSTVGDCSFELQPGIQASAEFQSDPIAIPRVGDVFYVRTVAGRIGEGCGIDMLDHVEIVPPPGVTPAISPSTPVRCFYMDITTTGDLTPASGCPQEVGEGVYGPAFDQLTPGGPTDSYPWSIDYGKALVVEIPLRSSRPLSGTSPTCARYEGAPPCLPAQSGDTLQFTEKIIDGWFSPWLSPYVPLFVQPAPAAPVNPGGGGSSAPGIGRSPIPKAPGGGKLVSVARSVRLARLVKGLPLTINVASAGSAVEARLFATGVKAAGYARPALIARKVVRHAGAGTLRLRLKPSRKIARRLRHVHRRLTATLAVRVAPPSGQATGARVRIAVRP